MMKSKTNFIDSLKKNVNCLSICWLFLALIRYRNIKRNTDGNRSEKVNVFVTMATNGAIKT